MSDLTLVIGDRNLSSWSMRAWFAMKASGLPFNEVLIPLDQPETDTKLQEYSPSGKVPCLIHGDLRIWDSLAISEYIHELAPEKNLWPKDSSSRALARAYTCEMHSGFQSLRSQLSMDLRLRMEARHLVAQTILDIQRIVKLWDTAMSHSQGPFLFGEFGIVDAFYAPVVFRFASYGIKIQSKSALKYMTAIESQPMVQDWSQKALIEDYRYPIF